MIYLNNAATSFPKPDAVAKAAYDAAAGPPTVDGRGGKGGRDVFDELRKALAEKLGVDEHTRITLAANSTTALNTAIFGMNLRRGDCVVTTMAEHNAVLRPLYSLSRRGINVIFTQTDAEGYVRYDEWYENIRKYRPKLCVMTHASNVTGAVNDVAKFCTAARKYGAVSLVDASQTLGIVTFDNRKIQADMIAFTSHKYLLSTPGCGGLYVSENVKLSPHILGGTGIYSDSEDMPHEYPKHLEAGTMDHISASCLSAALEWAKENPVNLRKINSMAGYISDSLRTFGCRVIQPCRARTPVISFTIPGMSVEDAGYILTNAYGIALRTGLHCAPLIHKCIGTSPEGTIRISLSRFTGKDDCRMFLKAVKEIMR